VALLYKTDKKGYEALRMHQSSVIDANL